MAKCQININSEVVLMESEALLDGSLKLELLSKEKTIATGYYCAPGFEMSVFESDIKNNEVGFKSGIILEALCLNTNNENIVLDDNITCKISPINMWLLEK